jgi:bifunctional UDP-N-acetylglucosamine pyrophosphorylase/glucosamine-1-phosphate N-acetyltransferase
LPINVVVGANADFIKQTIRELRLPSQISFSVQDQPRGTGDAVASSFTSWGDAEHVLVINGDMPLVQGHLIQQLMTTHLEKNATVSFVTSNVLNPFGYGRVVEGLSGIKIVEEKDCDVTQKQICKINAGIYLFKRTFLEQYVGVLSAQNAASELYLTDLVGKASSLGEVVSSVFAPFDEVQGVNTVEEFWIVEQTMRSQLVRYWVDQGVYFENPNNLHLDVDVQIGAHTRIGTGALLLRGSVIGADCIISPFSILGHAIVGDGTLIKSHTVVQDSVIGSYCVVGPFVRIKNNSVVRDGSRIESFVELSACTLGDCVVVHRLACLENLVIDAHSVIANQVSSGTLESISDYFGDEISQQRV